MNDSRGMASVPGNAGGQEETEGSTDTSTSTNQGTGHKTKTTSWKVGVFVEKVETQTATPPDYLDPPGGKQ